MVIMTIVISIFLAINMGASGFSVSFAPSYGCDLVKHKKAVITYTFCVMLGALLLGKRVVETLNTKLTLQLEPLSGLIIILATSFSLFITNLFKLPQSTSFVIVGAFAGAGLFYHKVNIWKIIEIFGIALIFSLGAFFFTFFLMKIFYPPKETNFRLHEKIFANNTIMNVFILAANSYGAFAIGTNNVANVVAPLLLLPGAQNPVGLILVFSPLFGLGGLLLGSGLLKTVSKDIIPLGQISAIIVSFVTSTFVIAASWLGLPTPYVQFTTSSILAISAIKDGVITTSKKALVQKILFSWFLVPLVTGGLTYTIHFLIHIISKGG
ncbi:inorganic phosphate transporter [Thermospira aquatica]|uniref:Inorganic phosphate transporter n=1 Tax=Thermospira aquatica TaxID=2828656 RepID=A0AAX3BAX7_9SPIR|nr:inorganic phosphate transporter [Thermospira aquatica]URA09228.1 inorganic phosphate transporter [Thermospira aquatica]